MKQTNPNTHPTGVGYYIRVVRIFDRWGWIVESKIGLKWSSVEAFEHEHSALMAARMYLRDHILRP